MIVSCDDKHYNLLLTILKCEINIFFLHITKWTLSLTQSHKTDSSPIASGTIGPTQTLVRINSKMTLISYYKVDFKPNSTP